MCSVSRPAEHFYWITILSLPWPSFCYSCCWWCGLESLDSEVYIAAGIARTEFIFFNSASFMTLWIYINRFFLFFLQQDSNAMELNSLLILLEAAEYLERKDRGIFQDKMTDWQRLLDCENNHWVLIYYVDWQIHGQTDGMWSFNVTPATVQVWCHFVDNSTDGVCKVDYFSLCH